MSLEKRGVAKFDKNESLYAQKTPSDKLVPLVDGPEILGAIGKAIGDAKEYIYLTAWLLHLDVKLGSHSLRQLLLNKAKQGVKVKIILCDLDIVMGKVGPKDANIEARLAEKFRKQDSSGNIQALVSPMKDLAWKGQALQKLATKYGSRPVLLGSHHQKTVIIDGKVGFCSGCDITVDVGNQNKWHDASIMLQGAGVHGLEQNFVERWNTEGEGIVEEISIGSNARTSDTCEIIRTMPAWWFDSTQIKTHYLATIREAKKTIYMENQYLRHSEIGAALEEAAQRGVTITIILPKLPEEAPTGKGRPDLGTRIGIYAQYKVLKPLCEFKNVTVLSPKKRTPYIHSKLLIADKRVTLLGSANANGRSMNAKADSEINALVTDSNFASELFAKLEKASRKWGLEEHNIENGEIISRLNEADTRPLFAARAMHDATYDYLNVVSPGAAAGMWAGSWMLTTFSGFGGLRSAEKPDEFRDAILDGLIDYI